MLLWLVSVLFVAQAVATPTPIPTISYDFYRVADLGKPGVPALTPVQLKWIKRIEQTPYYKNRIERLWFTLFPAPQEVPLVVFEASSSNRAAVEPNRSGWEPGYWVIGESCNAVFLRGEGVIATMRNDPDCESGKAQVKYH